jgi:DNA-binding LacI/PurR family transcriptional regulator
MPRSDASYGKRATIADVAALAGVSRGAVSQVFNGTGNISDQTSQRIREAARKLNWVPSSTAVALRNSFNRTVGQLGLTPVASLAGDYSAQSGAEHTEQLLTSPQTPTAIVYGADAMAIGGMAQARTLGVRIPYDLSVVGFDGLSVGQWLDPGLTTVQRDHVERGRAVATLMLRHLGETIDEEVVLRRPYLVYRGSTAPAAE